MVLADGRVRPDIVFGRAKLAVFVDGCFWHRCAQHGKIPNANRDYWGPKLVRNVNRDRANDRALEAEGWTVLRFFEHVDVEAAADMVEETLAGARA